MYFDIDCRMTIPEMKRDVLFGAAREISSRNGRIVAMSEDILVFSAPWWRVYGLLVLVVRQLPLGVSHGILDIVAKDPVIVIRLRISLFWLRMWISAFAFLVAMSLVNSGAIAKPYWWIASSILSAVCMAVYVVAVIEARRYFRNLLASHTEVLSTSRLPDK